MTAQRTDLVLQIAHTDAALGIFAIFKTAMVQSSGC